MKHRYPWRNEPMNNGCTFKTNTMLLMEAKHFPGMHIEHSMDMDVCGQFLTLMENLLGVLSTG